MYWDLLLHFDVLLNRVAVKYIIGGFRQPREQTAPNTQQQNVCEIYNVTELNLY